MKLSQASAFRVAILDNNLIRAGSVENHIRRYMEVHHNSMSLCLTRAMLARHATLEMAGNSELLIIGENAGGAGSPVDRDLAMILRYNFPGCQLVVLTYQNELLESVHPTFEGMCEYLLLDEEFYGSLSGIIERRIHEMIHSNHHIIDKQGYTVPLKVTNHQ